MADKKVYFKPQRPYAAYRREHHRYRRGATHGQDRQYRRPFRPPKYAAYDREYRRHRRADFQARPYKHPARTACRDDRKDKAGAFDTLYIGCEKFPFQASFPLPMSGVI